MARQLLHSAPWISLACGLATGLVHGLSSIQPPEQLSRRDAISVAIFSSVAASNAHPSVAASSNLVAPVLVLGASGKTGRECVKYLLQTGRPCIATTRTGLWEEDTSETSDAAVHHHNNPLLTIARVDVTDAASLQSAIANTSNSNNNNKEQRPQPQLQLSGVIYAASASKQGGTAGAVDRDGVLAAAEACLAASVPRFVLISSGAVTRPDSAIYKLLNSFGKIMQAKMDGENGVRQMYSSQGNANLGYTVIRPGGLTMEPPVGPVALELNQGDRLSGRLPRADVAALAVESIFSPDAFDATFECYETSTAKTLEAVGLSNILKSKDPTPIKTGNERRGDSYTSILKDLKRDPL